MTTLNRRITVTLSPELEQAFELLSKVFYRENESVLARILMENGVRALYGRKQDTGNGQGAGRLCFAKGHGRIYVKEECSLRNIIGEYAFPDVRIRVDEIYGTRSETVTYAKIVLTSGLSVTETEGIFTADGVLYVPVCGEYRMYPLGGRYVRDRRPVVFKEQVFIPVLLKKEIIVTEDENAVTVEGFSNAGDVEYYFCVKDRQLYRYDRKGGCLVHQRTGFKN